MALKRLQSFFKKLVFKRPELHALDLERVHAGAMTLLRRRPDVAFSLVKRTLPDPSQSLASHPQTHPHIRSHTFAHTPTQDIRPSQIAGLPLFPPPTFSSFTSFSSVLLGPTPLCSHYRGFGRRRVSQLQCPHLPWRSRLLVPWDQCASTPTVRHAH